MDRRESLKAIALSSLSAGVLLTGSEQALAQAKAGKESLPAKLGPGRTPEEAARDAALMKQKFFNAHELKTITVLADIIIPADEKSGSASQAKVPEFIEFIVKDQPRHQTPMRGGLQWLDIQCKKRYGKKFVACTKEQQLAMVDEIAYPGKAKPEMSQGVAFFNLMRSLTATGFFTSQIGIKDLGYVGNQPNVWNGVPEEVLKQYGLSYDEKTLRECVKPADRNSIATWES